MVDGVVIDDKLERADPKPIKGGPMTKHLCVLRCVLYCFHHAVSVSCTCCVCVSCCIALYRVVCVLRMGGRLNSLTVMLDRAEKGEKVLITRRGEPVVQLAPVKSAKPGIDFARLRALRATMPKAKISADKLVRKMRDEKS